LENHTISDPGNQILRLDKRGSSDDRRLYQTFGNATERELPGNSKGKRANLVFEFENTKSFDFSRENIICPSFPSV
jgi:hypothetical protein